MTLILHPEMLSLTSTQAGSVLIECLIAFGILCTAGAYAMHTLSRMHDFQDALEGDTAFSDLQSSVQSDAATFAYDLQMHLTNYKFSTSFLSTAVPSRGPQGAPDMTSSCRNAWTVAQGLLNGPRNSYLSPYFKGAIARGPVSYNLVGSSLAPLAKANPVLSAAIDRCATQQTLSSAQPSLAGKSSFYYCLLLHAPKSTVDYNDARTKAYRNQGRSDRLAAFGEFRTTFWDFARNVPLQCDANSSEPVGMRGEIGRGAIVDYTIYLLIMKPTAVAHDEPLVVKRLSGRAFVPKNTRGTIARQDPW